MAGLPKENNNSSPSGYFYFSQKTEGLNKESVMVGIIDFKRIFQVTGLILAFILACFVPKGLADGGDFSLDFAAAAPFTYNHATGGGAWNDGTIGKSADVVESLEGSDFACGDIVTHLLEISVDDQTTATNQTIELDFSFLADTTGQSGAALGDITFVGVNYGNVENGGGGGAGTFGIDNGNMDDGGSTAELISEFLTGPKFESGSELHGTVRIDDFEASEVVIFRIDTRIDCQPGSSPTGNLQSDIIDARVVSPENDTIQVGNQTVPFLKISNLAFPEVDLLVEKMDSPDPVELTQNLTYTIEVTNTSGDNIAENVTLTDTLDANTAFVSIDPAAGCSHDGAASGGIISCDVGPLDPNETKIYEVVVTVLVTAPDAGDGGSGDCTSSSDLCNQVTVATTTEESNLDNNSDSEPTDVIITGPFGAIEIDKQPDSGTVYPGTEYTYNYSVTHPGDTGPVQITDLSDDKCAPVNATDADNDTFNDGDSNSDGLLDPGETWLYSCTTTLTEDTTNIATVSAVDYWTGLPLEASDSAYVNVINPALTIDKQVDQATVLAGTDVTYTFVVTNSGDDPLESITVSDTVDGEAGCSPINYVSGDDGNNVLDLGESWTYTCSTQITEDTLNIATASGYDSLSNETVSAPDDAFVDVVDPAISIDKSAALTTDIGEDGQPGVDDTLTYTYIITNSGDTGLTNVTLSDDNQGFGTLGDFSCDTALPADMNAGDTITCSAEYIITQADVDAGSIYNLATTSGTPPLGDNVSDTDPETVDLPQDPKLDLVKTGSFNDENQDGFAQPGETISYSFTVTNTGNVTLTNVTVTDPLITVNGGPLASLAPGASDSTTFSATYTVTQVDVESGDLYNEATAVGTAPSGSNVTTVTDNDDENVPIPSGTITLRKLTDGAFDPSKTWNFTLEGPGVSASDSTTSTNNLLTFGAPSLSTGVTYTVCETGIPAGWTSIWRADIDGDGTAEIIPVYNPDATNEPPQDLGTRCYDFTVDDNETLAFTVDNRFPGGDPRTIGYWKNWNTCSGGNQADVAAANGGPAEGWYLLDDILNSPGITLGDYMLSAGDCTSAVRILNKSDVKNGKKRARDAAYELASQLLAAKLNHAAGAETCSAVQDAILAGDNLLSAIGFDGSGSYLEPKHKNKADQRQAALNLADTLDRYNNGELCN